MIKIKAFQLAADIDIKRFKNEFAGKPLVQSPTELFYLVEKGKFLHIFSFGVVVFSGYDPVKITETLNLIAGYSKEPLEIMIDEVFTVYFNRKKQDRFGYSEISVSRLNKEILRIIMLNVAQSVALDFYSDYTNKVFEATKKFTVQLEKKGKIDLSSKRLKQFIGHTLNIRNNIIDNLYIMDSPDVIWDDEYLDKIDRGLKKLFDIKTRFRDIDDDINNIKENLDLFKDMMQHSHSSFLEWIIIILIMIEVANMFVEKIWHFIK